MVLSLLSNKQSRCSKRAPLSPSSPSSKSPKASGSSTSVQLSPSGGTSVASSTLSEALRGDPFGTTPRTTTSLQNDIFSEADPESEKSRELQELNHALNVLAGLFPDVHPEVFRELLTRFDGKSRLEVSVEQLLRYRSEWVKGRWIVKDNTATSKETEHRATAGDDDRGGENNNLVAQEDLFRSNEYKDAVKAALASEFRSLSRSTINAVLAEGNFSYLRARPTLIELSQKTWRVTLGNIFSFKKRKAPHKDDPPPFLTWQGRSTDEEEPVLRGTGCVELDEEIRSTFLAPLLSRRREIQMVQDLQKAEELNEEEAKAVDALYECECCYSDVTFEQISTCSSAGHIICFYCIQRTLQEALFGQGWDTSIDLENSTLRCIAPKSDGICDGKLDATLVKRAVLKEKSGVETYRNFERRLASESLSKSNLKLIYCPFCSYAEVDPIFHPSGGGITWRFRKASLVTSILVVIILLDAIPLLIIPLIIILCLSPSALGATVRRSLQNICLKSRTQRFKCGNPSCYRTSCIRCHKPWNDPHTCHEPLLQSLRTTVEAARTAAVKRTCPRCGLSFVKASGCNKLTCVCGYSMCYICRKALGPKDKRRRNDNNHNDGLEPMDGAADVGSDNDDDGEEAEGYKHFCEHFRINPGSACTECTKCDLYQTEDEELVAQLAGEKAQQEWRIRQGMEDSLDDSVPSKDKDKGSAQRPDRIVPGYNWDLQFDVTSGGWRFGWKFWTRDLWKGQRLNMEVQLLVDTVLERLIVAEAT